jgi:uncharacterized protein YndB with AHSA1/START domain
LRWRKASSTKEDQTRWQSQPTNSAQCGSRLKCAQRVFEALTTRTGWFPATYGEERVREIVLEPRVGGAYYEDWGDGRGHLYGHITEYDPPAALAYRGRLEMGTILDTEYAIEQDGTETLLKVSKVAVGPSTEEQARGIHRYGDIANFEAALRRFVEGDA